MSYNSKYTGAEVEALLDAANDKQDKIEDLDAIREGASKGATALQSVPSEYVTESELTNKGYATTSALDDKVDKVSGKQLSTEDFTSALKTKLEGLSNYDDTELSEALSTLRGDFDKLVSGDTTTAIKTFNEVIAFLDGVQDTQDLSSIIASIEQQIAGKQATISDLDTIRAGAAKGATALQSYTEKYTGTITGIKMNGASKGTSGVVDLGTVITSHQDISGKVDKVTGKGLSTEDFTSALKSKLEGLKNYDDTEISNAVSSLQSQINTLVSGNANDAINSFNEIIAFLEGVKDTEDLASIIASIEQQIASKYTKPSGGIPASDLAPDVFLQGEKGEKGDKGDTGATGPQGPQGVSVSSVAQTTTSTADGGTNVVTVTLSNGTKSTFNVKNGSKGSNGTNGANGATFTPSVDANGNLSWTNDKGLANPATVNIKGPKGDSGEGGSGGGKEIVPVEVSSGSIILNEYRNIPFEPNKIYYAAAKVTENLSIQWVIPPTSDVAEYSLHFSIDSAFEAFTMDVPAEWQWVNGKVPEVNPYEDASYELSVVATKVNGSFVYKAVLTKFA